MSIEYSACELDRIRAKQREDEWQRTHTMDLKAIELKANRDKIREALKGQRFHRTQKVRARL